MAMKRLGVQVTEKLYEEVDKYAEEMNLSRAAAVSVLLTTSLKAESGMAAIKELMQAYKEQKNTITLPK